MPDTTPPVTGEIEARLRASGDLASSTQPNAAQIPLIASQARDGE